MLPRIHPAQSLLAFALLSCVGAASAQNVIGAGVGIVPEYDGARDYKARAMPLIQYNHDMFFIAPRAGAPAAGIRATLSPDWAGGLYLGLGFKRKAEDDLAGLDEVKTHGLAGAFLEWSPGRFSVSADLQQAMKSGYGATLQLGASYALLQTQKNQIRLGANTVWGNDDNMDTWFGISRAEAARSSRYDSYSASAGFRSAGLSLTWTHSLNDNWSVMTGVGVKTLLGDAKDSPISERDTSVNGSVGVLYRF